METDPKYSVNLSHLETPRIWEYIHTQEELGKAACTHLEQAWLELFNRGESDHK